MAQHKGRYPLDWPKEREFTSLYQEIQTRSSGVNHRMTWGKPAQIVQAKLDKMCPMCGAMPAMEQDFCFDMGYENGQLFGALCWNCGWSC